MDTLTETPLEIYLYQTQFDALQKLAEGHGVSVEELAQQAIEALLLHTESDAAGHLDDEELSEEELANDPLRAIIGLGRSGVTDLAENHDKYLMEFEIEDNQQWLQIPATEPDPAKVDEPPVESPLEAFIGPGRSGLGDLSVNHDKYLMEFEIESNRPPPGTSSPLV